MKTQSLKTLLGLAFGLLLVAVGSWTDAKAQSWVAKAQGSAHWTIDASVFGAEVGNRTLSFTATQFADGRVEGSWEYHQVFQGEDFRFTGRVTCVEVYDGNRAKIGGVIVTSNDATIPVGTFGWFQVLDHGEGAGAPPDQSTLMGIGSEAENIAFCNSPDPPRFGPWDVQGNIVVTD